MRKMVEIEYVGIEDVMELVELAHEVMLIGHYVNVEMFNINNIQVSITVQLGGWNKENPFDLSENFYLTDDKDDVKRLNNVKHYLNSLLVDEESEALN